MQDVYLMGYNEEKTVVKAEGKQHRPEDLPGLEEEFTLYIGVFSILEFDVRKAFLDTVGTYLSFFVHRDKSCLKIFVVWILFDDPVDGDFTGFLWRFALAHQFYYKKTADGF